MNTAQEPDIVIQRAGLPCLHLLLTVVLAGAIAPALANAQDVCPDQGAAGTHAAELFLSTNDNSCTVANGGYVATSGTPYKAHVSLHVTGLCQVMILSCSGLPPQCSCVPGQSYVRNIQATKLFDSHQSPYFAVIQPSNQASIQDLDTRVPLGTTSTGAGWLFRMYQETHTLTSNTNWNPTVCDLQPSFFLQDEELVVNAVKCEPKFREWNGHIIHLAANTTISVYLPGTMSGAYGALSNAANAWTTALAGTGVVIVPTQVDCSGSSNCIVVQTDSALAPCGYANPTIIDPQTGVISAGTIAVRTDWYSRYSSEGLERTFVHELGHFLGLHNYDKRPKCQIDDAAMQDEFDCYATSMLHEPAFSDSRASVNTTYGGGPKASCGF